MLGVVGRLPKQFESTFVAFNLFVHGIGTKQTFEKAAS